jgi:hypothetical protein
VDRVFGALLHARATLLATALDPQASVRIHYVRVWNRLRERQVDRLALGNPNIELAVDQRRADLRAVVAGYARYRIDVGGVLEDLEPALKERLRGLLPEYVGGLNPVDYTFSMDGETVKKTIEIGVESADVGSFIVVLQAEILGAYVNPLKSIDYKGKPIMACVAGKEFAMEDVIKMEKAGIPVYSTPEQCADAISVMFRHAQRIRSG